MAGVNYLTVYKLLEEIERHPCYESRGDKGMSAVYCYKILNRKGEYEVNAETWEEILKKLEAPKTPKRRVSHCDLPEEIRSKIMGLVGDLSGIHEEMQKVREKLRYPIRKKEIIAFDKAVHKFSGLPEIGSWLLQNELLRLQSSVRLELCCQRATMLTEKPYKCWYRTLNGTILHKLTYENLLKNETDFSTATIEFKDDSRNWTKSNINMKMSRVKLQGMCRENGLKVSGTKKDLIKRLMSL
jgi:hypothetical protein